MTTGMNVRLTGPLKGWSADRLMPVNERRGFYYTGKSVKVPLTGLSREEMADLSGRVDPDVGRTRVDAAVLSFLRTNSVLPSSPGSGWHGVEGICNRLKAAGCRFSEHEVTHALTGHGNNGGLVGFGLVKRSKRRVYLPSIGAFRTTWAYSAVDKR